ncbi:hypothetical protein [Burkholderia cenocepacia]|uniref:Uncharacterized protein n=1 Tax=Burkholderia cenocepacia TaxID=95486 RepID=A0ABD4UNZ0_9BURK|nr:hypothetical protein [Burkholderia cenocepacia]MCW3699900.1 hypothetical protein [Burkholderia cenocepacia]MCW3707561.1 hypothetical protein [Burkholderia cenocepacia]MCW3715801.1 hypothetical protein [Burkholderia cenocepacia]MCW3723885.1 hypothetical protein [Burkholderia cenocepacia]MCW3733241.1 hypothetical protein [Burkholderia cenocepacia]
MPTRSADELKKVQTRTVALMRSLMRRVGASNANQFAGWLTDKTKDWGWSDMQESKKWYPFVRGNIKREPTGALRLLSQLFDDADDLYRHGPGGIWSALWGPINEQVAVMRGHPQCLPKEPIDAVLRRIEEVALFGSNEKSQFEDFVRAAALYSYLVVVDPYGRIAEGNGVGHAYAAYRHVRSYLLERTIADELSALGIHDALCEFLADIERSRVGARPQWVCAIECGEVDERLRSELAANEVHHLARRNKGTGYRLTTTQ